MSSRDSEMYTILEQIFDNFPNVAAMDIPGIDLYMDQVTTFLQDNLRFFSRDPEGDKFLTKTMINNYVKNKVLPPPVKKKYSRNHMMMLIIIYYMKSFLSISDIRSISTPVIEYCSPETVPEKKRESSDKRRENAEKKREAADRKRGNGDMKPGQGPRAMGGDRNDPQQDPLQFSEIYDRIMKSMEEMLPKVHRDLSDQIDQALNEFKDVPGEDREVLQRFSLICLLSGEVYVRKLLIEKLLDT